MSPDLNPADYKIWGNKSTREKCRIGMICDSMNDAWVGVEQSVIDDATDQWHRRLYSCTRATEGHFDYLPWHKLLKTNIKCNKLS